MSETSWTTSSSPYGKTAAANRHKRFRWQLGLAATVFLLVVMLGYGMVSYHRFYHHVTIQELSHQVKHTTFQAPIRGGLPVTLQLYQEANATNQPLVLMTSGDGGWSPFCADVAAHIAATGKTVAGFNAKDYLVTFAPSRKPVSPDELARDYGEIIRASAAQPGVNSQARVTLAGWSLGAGYSILAAANPSLRDRLDRVVAISLPVYSELAWKPTDALIYITHGTPHEQVFDAHQYLTKLGSISLVMLNATADDDAPLQQAQSLFSTATGPKHLYPVKASGHHFEGGEEEFYRDLDQGLLFDPT